MYIGGDDSMMIELLEENEKLKNLCDKYEKEHETTFKVWKSDVKDYEKLKKENQRLNNILNELEEGYKKRLVMDTEMAKKYDYCLKLTIIEASESFLKTIQQLKKKYGLKESDK